MVDVVDMANGPSVRDPGGYARLACGRFLLNEGATYLQPPIYVLQTAGTPCAWSPAALAVRLKSCTGGRGRSAGGSVFFARRAAARSGGVRRPVRSVTL